MSSREDFRRALERKRALLRARDVEIERAKELRETAASIVLRSKNVVRRAQELLDELHEVRRQREPLTAETVT